MKTIFKMITFFMLLVLLFTTSLASEWRLISMGNARLALLDRDNDLNVYQYTFNPAYILFDESQNWLKFSSGGDYYHSNFRRRYDPEIEQNVFFHFTGYKIMAPNQAIWGRVHYIFKNRYHVPYAIDPHPYADDSALLADTTIGNIILDGPEIEIAYQYQPWSRLGVGLEVVYDLWTSLKEQYTRPRTIHRDFAIKFGLAYHILPHLVIGSWLQASFLQDQIELNKSWDGKDIYTRRYRSELVYRGIVQEFDRYINLDRWHYNLALQFLRQKYHMLLSFDYLYNMQEVADNTGTIRQIDSYWYQNGYQVDYWARIFINQLTLGVYGSYLAQTDFSKHPNLPILITDRSRHIYEVGAGISLPIHFLLLVGEVGLQQLDETYQDYQSKLSWNGQNNKMTGIVGCELTLDPIHYLRLGYHYNNFKTGFESPRYLPNYQGHCLSLGLSEIRSSHEIEVHFDYTLKDAKATDHSVHGWHGIIHTRIFIP